MLHNQNILCISSIDWDFLWQQHQEIMSAYAKEGNVVLFIENTGVRAVLFNDIPRVMRRIKNWFKSVRGFRQEMDNLYIYSPIILPFPYSRLSRIINRRIVVSAIKNWMKSADFHEPVIWTFLPTNITIDIFKNIDNKLLVYYCTDNFSATSKAAQKISKIEKKVIALSDVVFAMSSGMTEYCSQFNKNVVHVPMGVNLEKFSDARRKDIEMPPELINLNTPIIGYIGGVRKCIDQNLVCHLAVVFKNYTFVFIGPLQTDISLLQRFKNIKFIDTKKHDELPRYIKFFDCCIIPYLKNDYTDNVSPAKLNEYLVMGKPVVSINLTEIENFTSSHNDLIYMARNKDEFARCIISALEENNRELAQKRIFVAEGNAWPEKIEILSTHIESILENKNKQKEDNWKQNLMNLYRDNRKRAIVLFFIAFFLYSLIFYTPIIWVIANPLKISMQPQKVDVIVVLAGGTGESGQPKQGYEERVQHAVELYKKGYAGRMIFSSGYKYEFEEPRLMKMLAVYLGVPDNLIILEENALSTYQNIKFVKEILDENKFKSILLVSSPYHMRRVWLVVRKIAPGLKIIYSPIPNSKFYSHPLSGNFKWPLYKQINLRQIKSLMHEYAGIIYYWWKGYI